MAWSDNLLKEVLSEMATSHSARDKINEKIKVNTGTGSLVNRPLNIPNNVAPVLQPDAEYLRLFNSDMPKTVAVSSGNLSPYYEIPQTGLGEGYVRDPTYVPKSPSYVNSNNPLEWHPSSFNEPKINPFSFNDIARPALGTLAGLAALDEAINGKNPTALGMLIPNAAGMGLGSLFYSTPLNEGEDAMIAAINAGSNLPFQGSVAAATNGTDIGVADPNAAKQYADSIAYSLNLEKPNLYKIISNGSKLINPPQQQGTNQNQPKQDRRLLNNAEGVFLYEKAMRDKKPIVKATKSETTSGEAPATFTTAKTTPNTTTTPTNTADTDIAVKTPVYDRPDYTKGKSLLGLDELAKAIMAGEFGNGAKRKQRLMNAGYTPEEIANAQKLVNKTIAKPATRTNARTSTTRPVARRNVDSVIARPTVVNTPVQPVNTNYAPSGYAVGHEAYYDPIAGQLRFR